MFKPPRIFFRVTAQMITSMCRFQRAAFFRLLFFPFLFYGLGLNLSSRKAQLFRRRLGISQMGAVCAPLHARTHIQRPCAGSQQLWKRAREGIKPRRRRRKHTTLPNNLKCPDCLSITQTRVSFYGVSSMFESRARIQTVYILYKAKTLKNRKVRTLVVYGKRLKLNQLSLAHQF